MMNAHIIIKMELNYSPPHTNIRVRRNFMSYSIIGFGAVGQALARAFARQNIEVTVASRRTPETLAPQAQAIGSAVSPRTLPDALQADVIFLAWATTVDGDETDSSAYHGWVITPTADGRRLPCADRRDTARRILPGRDRPPISRRAVSLSPGLGRTPRTCG